MKNETFILKIASGLESPQGLLRVAPLFLRGFFMPGGFTLWRIYK